MSTLAVCIQPVAGATWKFGVPKEAKGLKLQSEVKAYDKDLWGDCIGYDQDDRAAQAFGNYREGYSPDGDNVGARSQSEISDWEKEDYWFMGDSLLYTKLDESIRQDVSFDRNGDKVSDLQTYWDAIPFARKTLLGLAGNTYSGEITASSPYYKPLIYIAWSIMKAAQPLTAYDSTFCSISQTTYMNKTEGLEEFSVPNGLGAWASTYSRAQIASMFNKMYKAVVVERDVWYWDKDVDFDSDPDEEDAEAPFIEDPENLYDSWAYFTWFTEALFDQVELIISDMNTLFALVNYSKGMGGKYYHSWEGPGAGGVGLSGFNSTWDLLNTSLTPYLLSFGLGPQLINNFNRDAFFAWWYIVKNALQWDLLEFFRSKIPDKGEFLVTLLKAGIPAHQDVGKWLEKMIDEFDLDEDTLYGSDKFNTDVYPWILTMQNEFYIDISLDGLTVTVDIEWEDYAYKSLVAAPGESLEEKDDYTMTFVYGDTGGQSSVTYQQGDDIFYKQEGIAPTIAGFEISILLAAAGISAIGLIYAIMKRRK